MAGTVTDAVYVVKWSDRNEELRYSLRSVTNIGDLGTVWVFGGRPLFLGEHERIRHVYVPQEADRYRNAEDTLLAALRTPEVPDGFYLFNDDFFVTRPTDTVPVLNRGDAWTSYRDQVRRFTPGDYLRAMKATLTWLSTNGYERPLSYETHAPLKIDKEGMAAAIQRGRLICNGAHIRTLYGNFQDLGGLTVTDCKVWNTNRMLYPQEHPFLSTNDQAFKRGHVGYRIRQMFPEPQPWEKDR
jgi:hypothetical protein